MFWIKNILNLLISIRPFSKGLLFVFFLIVSILLFLLRSYLISRLHTELPTEIIEDLLPAPREVKQVVESVEVSSPKGNRVDSSYLYISLAIISVVLICGGGFLYYMYGGGNPAEVVLEARPEVVAQPAVAEAAAQVVVQAAEIIGEPLSQSTVLYALDSYKFLVDNQVAITEVKDLVKEGVKVSASSLELLQDSEWHLSICDNFTNLIKSLFRSDPNVRVWFSEEVFSRLTRIEQNTLVAMLKHEFPNIDLPSFIR